MNTCLHLCVIIPFLCLAINFSNIFNDNFIASDLFKLSLLRLSASPGVRGFAAGGNGGDSEDEEPTPFTLPPPQSGPPALPAKPPKNDHGSGGSESFSLGKKPVPAPRGQPLQKPTPAPRGQPLQKPTPAPRGQPLQKPTPAPRSNLPGGNRGGGRKGGGRGRPPTPDPFAVEDRDSNGGPSGRNVRVKKPQGGPPTPPPRSSSLQ
ncbi:mucin 5 [Cryptosporidium sp. chipmunk genotype I]|uniref:mucin 5 n=1 Tax=Cryptosporidium sp. chipmunk genotype I TaxID=1280935 RepID=UPI00351A3E78|nr:mucin 5 [Cryptosporidium sp. chipmunk genotype I]